MDMQALGSGVVSVWLPIHPHVGRLAERSRAVPAASLLHPGKGVCRSEHPTFTKRRALGDDVLPPGLNGDPNGYPIGKGADLFISMWNLHR